jgi:hypothetical protein
MTTRKDFRVIAKIICHCNIPDYSDGGHIIGPREPILFTESLVRNLCDYFENNNTSFDRNNFIEICGLKDIK